MGILDFDKTYQWMNKMAEDFARVIDNMMQEEYMAEKCIQKAIKKPGALHKELGVPKGKKIPEKKLDAAAKKGGKEGKRARLAKTLEKMHK